MRARQQQLNQIYGSGEMLGCQNKGAEQTISDTKEKNIAATQQQQQLQLLTWL